MMLNRRQASAAAAALFATAVQPGAAQGGAAPVAPVAPALKLELFFREPEMIEAVLSPAGTQVALRSGAKDARVRLLVLRLDTMKVQVVASFSDADVGHFQWVNENRLAFALEDRQTAPADRRFAYGLFAVNTDGEGFRQLAMRERVFVKDSIGTRQLPWNTFMLGQAGPQTSDELFVVQPEAYGEKGFDFFKLLRLDTVTGRSEEISTPVNAINWLFDAKGARRMVLTEKDNLAGAYHPPPGHRPGCRAATAGYTRFRHRAAVHRQRRTPAGRALHHRRRSHPLVRHRHECAAGRSRPAAAQHRQRADASPPGHRTAHRGAGVFRSPAAAVPAVPPRHQEVVAPGRGAP